MIKKSAATIAILLASLLASGAALAADSDITIRAGLAKPAQDGHLEIYKETTSVSLIPKTVDPNYFFGVFAASASGKDFKCRLVLSNPAENQIHEANSGHPSAFEKAESTGGYKIIRLKEESSNTCGVFLRFDEDDIPGKYGVEIFIGGKSAKKIEFDVKKP